MFHAFPIEHEQAMPKVGDLVAYARPDDLTKAEKSAGKKAREPSFEEAKSWFMRLDDDDDYLSHSDLVVHVAADDRFLEVIGGNVGQSVTKKIIPLDERGRIADRTKPWFAVLRNDGS